MAAAWFLAVLLLAAVGTAPWEKLRASHPSGVVDVATQRFEIRLPGGLRSGLDEADHRHDARFLEIHPEGP
ncbi:MAG: hypothetical protein ACT443_11335 [Gemmatimonadota bacterium]